MLYLFVPRIYSLTHFWDFENMKFYRNKAYKHGFVFSIFSGEVFFSNWHLHVDFQLSWNNWKLFVNIIEWDRGKIHKGLILCYKAIQIVLHWFEGRCLVCEHTCEKNIYKNTNYTFHKYINRFIHLTKSLLQDIKKLTEIEFELNIYTCSFRSWSEYETNEIIFS